MIRAANVTMRFATLTAVDAASLHVAPGESVALWGLNGAGKSTLIRCVLGLLAYEGTIEIGGLDVRRRGKHARRLIGYVPQDIGFYDDLRTAEAIAFFAALKGVRVRRADDPLARVGLGGHGSKRVRELSGGMKQRLALAIALLGEPPVLVLDEVTASLDSCGREEFVALLARLGGEGRTILFASHRIDEIAAIASRVVLLERGRVAGEAAPRDLLARLGHSAVLHLHLAPAARAPAMDLLRAGGFAPRLNGVGVLVPVPDGQKARPFRVLAEGRIAVDDFEVLGPSAGGAP